MNEVEKIVSAKATRGALERHSIPEPAVESPRRPIDMTAAAVMSQYRIIRFRGKAMIRVPHGYVALDGEKFQLLAYPLVGGMTRSRISDVYAYVRATAEDLTDNDHFIAFGSGTDHPTVWDMETLKIRDDILPDDCPWHSPYAIKGSAIDDATPSPLLMSLVGGDTGLYIDIMQSLAPLIMKRKPDGVIWWVGDGTDGKMAIIEVLCKIFPGQLTSINVKQLVGGRSNSLSLNRVLGNIAEDGGGRIFDAEVYKSIGAHQNFGVHKYHSQTGADVRGDAHHIFSAVASPTFGTNSMSALRRTHIIEFGNNPRREIATPSDDSIGHLLAEMCRQAIRIKQRGTKYQWSGK